MGSVIRAGFPLCKGEKRRQLQPHPKPAVRHRGLAIYHHTGAFFVVVCRPLRTVDQILIITFCVCRDNGDDLTEGDIHVLNEKINKRKKKEKKKELGDSHIGDNETLLNGIDLLEYLNLVQSKGSTRLRPMCAFFIGILPFIPTSVLCERSFSVYNTIMRSDRTTLGNEVVADCVLLKSYNQVPIFDVTGLNSACFEIDDYRHIYPYVVCTHIREQQDKRVENLRGVCKRKYMGN